MASAYFQVKLTVSPCDGGDAKLLLPSVFGAAGVEFLAVRDGAEEGIVRADAPDAVLDGLDSAPDVRRLSERQLDAVKRSYPPMKLKRKYRLRRPMAPGGAIAAGADLYELDAQGRPVVDTWQTVRSGFYLIDVPVNETP
jgi:hypothetical protein